jgi:GH25 family lysozyme M1 (1,4-beta-N-acetylmuramidase)
MAESHQVTVGDRRRRGWPRLAALAVGTAAALAGVTAGAQPATAAPSGPKGVDVSTYQGSVGWSSVAGSGRTFAYVKATEGNYRVEPSFAGQYNGAYKAGLIRGAYHFARPDKTTGAAQADYFVAHGGGWSADGKTLPGVVDLEWGTPFKKGTCYGLSQSSMNSWIKSFTAEYEKKTGRDAVIYTVYTWWSQCTGGLAMPANPVWVAGSSPVVPKGFTQYTFWQYGQASVAGIGSSDVDVFNGTAAQLKALATGNAAATKPSPTTAKAAPGTASPSAPAGGTASTPASPAASPAGTASSGSAAVAAASSPATGTGAGSGSLPVTGVGLGAYVGGAVLLLGGGGALFLLARRRRTT